MQLKQKPDLLKKDQFFPELFSLYPQLDSFLKPEHRIQIIYTVVDRKKDNQPLFTHHYFQVDPDQYFYPASTVKMPIAFLALQKLNELKIQGLDRNTTMVSEKAFEGQTPVYNDPTTEDGRPTIANYIKKIFLVSDNDAFNRLYEFLGQEYIHQKLHTMGYDSVQILHRLNIVLSEEQNRHTNPVKFYDTSGNVIYEQPLVRSDLIYQKRNTLLGKGYYSGGQLIEGPFDFSNKNRISLPDLHSMLMTVIFPEIVPSSQRFGLNPDDYNFLYRYMSMLPGESDYPYYGTHDDAVGKFLFYGGKGRIEDQSLKIFNKIGNAYGFLTDAAYFADFNNNIEFFLSANIYCNSDGIFNDDKYDYDRIGYPFLKQLGRIIYEYERKRKRKNPPDLTTLKNLFIAE